MGQSQDKPTSTHAPQSVCTQLNGFDGWKQDGKNTMTLGWYFASTLQSVSDSEKTMLRDIHSDHIFRPFVQVNGSSGCFSVFVNVVIVITLLPLIVKGCH